MQQHTATIVVDTCSPSRRAAAEQVAGRLTEQLEVHPGAVSRTPRGRLQLSLTMPADSLRRATNTALALAESLDCGKPSGIEAVPTNEWGRLVGMGPMP